MCRPRARLIACRVENLALAAADRAAPSHTRRCPCCGWYGWRFRSFAVLEYLRRDVICPRCGSFERHRALARFYPMFFEAERFRPRRLVHFAAEPCLTSILASLCDRYETSAFDVAATADLRLDLTRLDLPDQSCDALVMNHVLDCMPDDRPAVSEMFRVLRPGGAVLAVVTFEPGSPSRETPVSSNNRYRVYGSADIDQRFNPFDVSVVNAARDVPSDTRRMCGIPNAVHTLLLRKTLGSAHS